MNIVDWLTSPTGHAPPPESFCSSPESIRSRVEELAKALLMNGWAPETMQHVKNACLKILLSRFDRNGNDWRDIEGCWFQWKLDETGKRLAIQLADRGAILLISPTVQAGKTPKDLIDLGLEPGEKRLRDGLIELEQVKISSLELSSGEFLAGYGTTEEGSRSASMGHRALPDEMKIHGLLIDAHIIQS